MDRRRAKEGVAGVPAVFAEYRWPQRVAWPPVVAVVGRAVLFDLAGVVFFLPVRRGAAIVAWICANMMAWRGVAIAANLFAYDRRIYYQRPYFRFDSILIGGLVALCVCSSASYFVRMGWSHGQWRVSGWAEAYTSRFRNCWLPRCWRRLCFAGRRCSRHSSGHAFYDISVRFPIPCICGSSYF